MDQAERDGEQTQPTPAWGDTVMPGAAAERQANMNRLHPRDETLDQTDQHPAPDAPATRDEGGPPDEPLLYAGGHAVTPDDGATPPYTTPLPQTDTLEGNWAPLLGPGNEAMEGGASPAPRGYTGGAMGRVVSGLSPSFPKAASGAPPEPPAPGSAAPATDQGPSAADH